MKKNYKITKKREKISQLFAIFFGLMEENTVEVIWLQVKKLGASITDVRVLVQ